MGSWGKSGGISQNVLLDSLKPKKIEKNKTNNQNIEPLLTCDQPKEPTNIRLLDKNKREDQDWLKTKKTNQFSQVNMMENSHLPNLELRHFLTLTLVGTGIMASAFRLFNAASIPLGIVRVGKPPTGTKCSSGFGEWRIFYALCVFLGLLEVGARHFAWCVFSCVFRSTVGARHLVSRRCCIWFAAGFFFSHVFLFHVFDPKRHHVFTEKSTWQFRPSATGGPFGPRCAGGFRVALSLFELKLAEGNSDVKVVGNPTCTKFCANHVNKLFQAWFLS